MFCVFFNMSENSNLNAESEFKTVSYKKKRSKLKKSVDYQLPQTVANYTSFDKESYIRRILNAQSEISTTDLFDSLTASLKEALSALENPQISKIIILGIGKIGECIISRYQFALLLCLRNLYDVSVSIYDPVLNVDDFSILNHFDIAVLTDNLEGKYKIEKNKTVLFYLPHCPKQLSNNLLWANWGLNLKNCIIIANSFNRIIEQCSSKILQESAEYIAKIVPYTLELPVINSFKYYEIFNDTAIHVFPKLNYISEDLWNNSTEPEYSDDIEFIQKVQIK